MSLPEILEHYNGMQVNQRVVYCPVEGKPEFLTINKIERVRGPNGNGTAVRFYTDAIGNWVVPQSRGRDVYPRLEDTYCRACPSRPGDEFSARRDPATEWRGPHAAKHGRTL